MDNYKEQFDNQLYKIAYGLDSLHSKPLRKELLTEKLSKVVDVLSGSKVRLYETIKAFRFNTPDQENMLNFSINKDKLVKNSLSGFSLSLDDLFYAFVNCLDNITEISHEFGFSSRGKLTKIFDNAYKQGLIEREGGGRNIKRRIKDLEKTFDFLYNYKFKCNKVGEAEQRDILFYLQCFTKKEILKDFKISTKSISTLMTHAHNKNIIIPIANNEGILLEERLSRGLTPKKLLVTESEIKQYFKLNYQLGKACRDYYYWLYFNKLLSMNNKT